MLTASPAGAQVLVDEIFVTAQKRTQDQQDVGIAITALSSAQLEALGYTNAQEVAAFAPGVVSVQPNGEGNYSFAIRGVANNDLTTNVESPVAVYVDDIYISQMSGTGFLLFDVDQVAILRGPQGTLFGRNATGGLVQYTTKKPGKAFGGFGAVAVGEHSDLVLQGAVNLPINDWLSARLSAGTHTSTGYITNREHPEEKLNNNNDYGARLQILAQPSDTFSFLFNVRTGGQEIRTGFFEYISAVNGGGVPTPGALNPLFGSYIDTDGDIYAGDYNTRGHNISELFGVSGTFTWEVGGIEFVSLTDYQTVFRDYIEDTDATPTRYYEYYQTNDAKQFSQELRASKTFGKLNLVAGAYYMDLSSDDSTGGIAPEFYSDIYGLPIDQLPANGDRTPSSSKTKSFSLFGQGEYALNDQWTLIAGARWISESRDFESRREDVLFAPNATSGLDSRTTVETTYTIFDPPKREDSLWAGRLQLNYQPSKDLLTYVSWNRGVKSGGFSQPPFDPTSTLIVTPELLSYDPEILDAFEAGMKWDVIPGALRINASGYYYDYSNYQAYTNFPGGLGSATVNAQAVNKGGEVEIEGSPLEGMDLRLGVGYTDVKVSDVIGYPGQTLTSVNTPEWNLTGLVRYEFPIGDAGRLSLQADAQYQSEHYFSLSVTPATTEDGYVVANASVGWMPEHGDWTLNVSVKNLFEEEYLVQTFDLSDWIGMIEHYYGRPRFISARLSWVF